MTSRFSSLPSSQTEHCGLTLDWKPLFPLALGQIDALMFSLQVVRYFEGGLTSSLACFAAFRRLELLDVLLPDSVDSTYLDVTLSPDFKSEHVYAAFPTPPYNFASKHSCRLVKFDNLDSSTPLWPPCGRNFQAPGPSTSTTGSD